MRCPAHGSVTVVSMFSGVGMLPDTRNWIDVAVPNPPEVRVIADPPLVVDRPNNCPDTLVAK